MVEGKVNLKRSYHHSNKYYLKHIVPVLLDCGHNRHLVLLPRQNHAVSLLELAGFTVVKYVEWDPPEALAKGELNFLHYSNSKESTQDLIMLSKARL